VGFSEEQAELLTELQKTTSNNTLDQAKHDYDLENISSKKDIELLELNLKRDIKELELSTKRDLAQIEIKIAETKTELIC
jgi:hypothetical protein